ncbi:MAG: ATP-binding cassette domain-containing protein [Nostocales cyanobacterium]|nr:MAG: ATP-binding cassette domain-containing protein [Nostocales cyanobacterium]
MVLTANGARIGSTIARRKISALSGGQLRRVFLACALLDDSEILLLSFNPSTVPLMFG